MKRVAVPQRGLMAAVVLTCLALLALSARAQQPAQPKKGVTIEGITEYQLDNGVRFLLFPDPSSSTVTVNMTVLVGSRHEGYGETGMAHLLEHMLFKGTPTFPKIDQALQEHGAGRTANGTTWVDRTNYYETMPATDRNLEFGIKLEADRLVNSFVKREDLVKEMTVVRNEFEQGENTPEYILSQRMMAVAFEWHNYGKSTIGNRSDIEKVPIERLQAFYRKYYQPDNVVLIVAGKFDEQKALQYVSKYFGALKRPARVLEKTYTDEPAQDGERNVVLRRVGKVGLVGVLYHVPAGSHPDFAAVDVLNTMLVSEPNGRLYKALVETKKATSVNGAAFAWHDPGVIELTAKVADKVKPEEVRDVMLKELETLAAGKVTDEEVERAKRKILAERRRALAKSTRIALELSEWVAAGDWRLLFLHRDHVAKVTPADIQRVAEKYLQKSNRTVGMYVPTAQVARAVIPETPNVAALVKDYKGGKAVAQGEPFDPTPANLEARVKRLTLPGGVKVALLPKKTRGETVVGRLVLRFGNEKTLTGQKMAAEFLGPMLLRGTKKYSRQDIEDELDVLESTLSAGSGLGQLTFAFETKRDKLPAVLDLLKEVLHNPTFPQQEFEILRRAERQDVEKGMAEPQALAGNALSRHLNPYPKGNIHYAPTLQEQLDEIDRVTLDDVRKLYRNQLGTSAGEFVLVGDFDADAAAKLIEGVVGERKASVPYERIAKKAAVTVKGGKAEILTPDKENAVYLGGYLFPMADTAPDYPALRLGNYLLGVGFTSRLVQRVREKEGLSYGVGSQVTVVPIDDYGSFVLFAITNPMNINKVNAAMREELDRLLKDGITEAELSEAKKGFLQDQKVGRANDRGVAGQLAAGLFLSRTFKFAEDIERRVAALTVEDVNRALRAHLTPGRLYIIHAGDFKKDAPQK